MSTFRFKQFEVSHEGPAMKVGTDGVLLGAWCTLENLPANILDVGTGSGVIALMLAQRSGEWKALVEAVDTDEQICRQATGNFNRSPWSKRLRVICRPVQELADIKKEAYDLIVSNPPYFEQSMLPASGERARARHTLTLSADELLQAASVLLRPEGILAVVLPVTAENCYLTIAALKGLQPQRITRVRMNENSEPKRILLEFRKTAARTECSLDSLAVQHSHENFTEQYRRLTSAFYLAF